MAEIVERGHKILETWWERVQERGEKVKESAGALYGRTASNHPSNDDETSGAQISRLVMPNYVAVLPNGDLEGPENWSTVSNCPAAMRGQGIKPKKRRSGTRDQRSPRSFRSDRIENRIPATVRLPTFSPAFQALVSTISWDNPSAVLEERRSLGHDRTLARILRDRYRHASLVAFKKDTKSKRKRRWGRKPRSSLKLLLRRARVKFMVLSPAVEVPKTIRQSPVEQ